MTAKKLDSLRKSNLIKSLNISKSVSSLDDSLRNSNSPLIQGNMMYLFFCQLNPNQVFLVIKNVKTQLKYSGFVI